MIDKREALKTWTGTTTEQNHLFYQARNLAVEAVCLRLENIFMKEGLPVSVKWKESSFPGATLLLTLVNPKKNQSWEELTGAVHITRGTIRSPMQLSSCFYEYQGYSLDIGSRAPQLALKLKGMLQTLSESVLPALIQKVNYPFDCERNAVY